MRCAEVREILPGHLRDGEESLLVRRHLARCPDCRAELARYEKVLEGLGALVSTTADPPPALLRSLIAIPASETRMAAVRDHIARNRRRYLGGAAVAALGVAGTAVWWGRRRLAAA